MGEGLEQSWIHSMLIQPVVENAIMHGLSEKLGSGETAIVRIAAERNGNALLLHVWDNGVGMTEEQCMRVVQETDRKQSNLHIGLSNIHKRIKYLYGSSYGLNIYSEPGQYTEVILTLPLSLPEA